MEEAMERAAAEELANSCAAPHAAQTSSAIPAVFALMAAAQALNDAHNATPKPPPQPPLAGEEESGSPAKHVATVGPTVASMNSKRFRSTVEQRYGSVDSSDTFLSCNTHPFPSQGSLAGLEEMAAKGSMAANGSMPAVNISGINSVYVNPFEPPKPKLSASIMGSPCSRRMRYARNKNNLSSDTEEAWADALDREEEEDSVYRQLRREATGEEDPAAAADWGRVNKRPNPRFDIDPEDVKVQLRRGSASDNDKDLESGLAVAKHHQPRSSTSARRRSGSGGLGAVLNSLGEKFGGGRSGRETAVETLDMAPLAADIESPPSNGGVSAKAKAKKSILKRGNSSPAERENLLTGDPSKPSTSSSAAVTDSTARSGESAR